MKKIIPFLSICALLIIAAALLFLTAALPSRLAFKDGESYCFYVGDTSKDCKVINTSRALAPVTRLTLKGVCGESATYGVRDPLALIESLGGEIVFKEELSDSVNYYCKAPLPYSVTLYGEEINLHVCAKSGGVTAGSPIIFGGY